MSNSRMRGHHVKGRKRRTRLDTTEIPVVPGVIPADTPEWQEHAMADAHKVFAERFGNWPGRHVTIRTFTLKAGLDLADKMFPGSNPPASNMLMQMCMDLYPEAATPAITFASLELNDPGDPHRRLAPDG